MKGFKRLSVQSLGPDERVLNAVRQGRPALFKVVNPDVGWVQKLHAASPETVLIGRIVDNRLSERLTAPAGKAFAEQVLQKAEELGGVVKWWEGSNEAASGPEGIKRLTEFERAFAEKLQSEGYHALVGGFSTGVPEIVGPNSEVPWMGEWALFYPAMEVAHGVHFHEYWHPYRLQERWHAFRFTLWWPALPAWAQAKWWLVSELGIDGGLAGEGRRGWMAYVPRFLYLDLLTRYAAEMAEYPHLAATIFAAGIGVDRSWATFDIRDTLLDELSRRWASAPPERWGDPVPADQTPDDHGSTVAGPLVMPGARNLIDRLPVRQGTTGYTEQRALQDIDLFVVHWLGAYGRNLRPETVWRWQVTHQEADHPKFPAGAYHFQITQDGTITQLHRLTTVTWNTTGVDEITGKSINEISIAVAIEPERRGESYRYTDGQISACLALYDWLSQRVGRSLRVAGHNEVRPRTPDGRPTTACPGPAWPLQLKPLLLERQETSMPLPPWTEATRVAWQSVIYSYNPDFALPKKAIQVLGPKAFPLTEEVYFELDGTTWVRQLWTDGEQVKMLLTLKGHWDLNEIRVVKMPALEQTQSPPSPAPIRRFD